MEDIKGFHGEYRWLSNFWAAPLTVGSMTFATSEHAYQAAKSLLPNEWALVNATSSPGRAKRIGQQLTLRPDWEDIKIEVMREIIAAKFDQNPDLKTKLLATKGRRLFEENTWGDTFWGTCNGFGRNYLGLIIMNYRDE